MVEYGNVERLSGATQRKGNALVLLACDQSSRRMVVRHDDSARPVPNRLGKDFTRMYLRPVGEALGHQMHAQNAVAAAERNGYETFLATEFEKRQMRKKRGRRCHVRHPRAEEKAAREFQTGEDLRRFRTSESADSAKFLQGRAAGHLRKELRQFLRKGEDVLFRGPPSENQGEQVRCRKGFGAILLQAFAREILFVAYDHIFPKAFYFP